MGTGNLFHQDPQHGLFWLFVRQTLEIQRKSHNGTLSYIHSYNLQFSKTQKSQSHCFPYSEVRLHKMHTFYMLLSHSNLQSINLNVAGELLVMLGHVKAVKMTVRQPGHSIVIQTRPLLREESTGSCDSLY